MKEEKEKKITKNEENEVEESNRQPVMSRLTTMHYSVRGAISRQFLNGKWHSAITAI